MLTTRRKGGIVTTIKSNIRQEYILYRIDFIWNWAESFFTLIEIFLSVYNKLLLINDDLPRLCGQKGGSDCRDVSPVPLESHDPWAKSLHPIMNEHKILK
jgi:hypothetical protein